MWKALLFFSVWIGITIPILLSIVFTIFKPLVLADETGISHDCHRSYRCSM